MISRAPVRLVGTQVEEALTGEERVLELRRDH